MFDIFQGVGWGGINCKGNIAVTFHGDEKFYIAVVMWLCYCIQLSKLIEEYTYM